MNEWMKESRERRGQSEGESCSSLRGAKPFSADGCGGQASSIKHPVSHTEKSGRCAREHQDVGKLFRHYFCFHLNNTEVQTDHATSHKLQEGIFLNAYLFNQQPLWLVP